MIHYIVSVIDRIHGDKVVVGAMLEIQECRELVSVLKRFNATDFEILVEREVIV